MSMSHYDGDPNGCSATCNGPHIGEPPPDAPESCPECGGNIRACWPRCTEYQRRRPYEEFEGHTGAEELGPEDCFPTYRFF